MSVKIRVNGKNLDMDQSGVTNIADLVEKIKKEMFEPGELIVSLTVDGDRMDPGSLDAPGNLMPVSQAASMEIESMKRPLEKAAELLRAMGDYLGKLSDGAGNVADKFRIGEEEEANAQLGRALDGLGVFTELVETVKNISRTDITAIADGAGESLGSKEARLLKSLKEMEGAQMNNDWVLVADILEYDVGPLINEWKTLLPLVERELLKGGN